MRRRALVLLSGLLVAAGLSAVPSSAVADGTRDVGLTGFADIVVDAAHGHVFVSQGNDRVVVTDEDGDVVQVLDQLYGAAGMTLDGDTLWVALEKGDGIAALDTATLERTVYPTGPEACPDQVAVTAGIVWFTGGCGTDGQQLGELDPADGSVHLDVLPGGATLLAASPAVPDSLFVVRSDSQGADLIALDAVGGESPALTERARRSVGSAADLAVTPDGTQVVVAGYQEHPVYRASDLSAMGAYESGPGDAVAIRADGMVAAGVYDWYDTDIFVYRAGSSALYRGYELGGPDNALVYRSLAFGPVRLYGVVAEAGGGNYRLRVITPRRNTSLVLKTAGDEFAYGEPVPVTVRLKGVDHPAGQQVSVYASTIDGEEQLVAQGPVDATGLFSADVPAHERTTFRAVYQGNDEADPARAGKVTVLASARVTPTMQKYRGRSGKYYVYGARSRAWMQAQVAPNHAGDCVYFDVQYFVRGSWGHSGRTRCITLDSRSRGWVYLDGSAELVGIPIRLRADWNADKRNTGTETGWRYLRFKR